MGQSLLMAVSTVGRVIFPLLLSCLWLFPFSLRAADGDTVQVNCLVGESAYRIWLDNLSIRYKLPVIQAGGSVLISPLPEGYPAMRTCEDTVRHTFAFFDARGQPTGSRVFLFIRRNLTGPAILSPFPDTLRLSCTDSLPGRNAVSFRSCQLASVNFEEVVTRDSLCALTSKVVYTWTATDHCNRQTSYRLVVLVAPPAGPGFLQTPSDRTLSCGTSVHPVATGRPVPREDCGSVALSYQDSIVGSVTINCSSSYVIFRKWTALGPCASRAEYIQRITITHERELHVICPSDTVLFVSDASCAATAILPYPDARNLCPSGFLEYRIDDGNTLRWREVGSRTALLPAGFHRMTYGINNCSGGITSCTWFVEVKESTAPEISCGIPRNAVLPSGECIAPVPLPRPTVSADNCNQSFSYQQRHALDSSFARAVFTDVLTPFTVSFDGIPTKVSDSARISLSFRLNMADPTVRLNLRGERNELIGVIPSAGLSCNTLRTVSFAVPEAVVRNWISDGRVTFTVEPVGRITPCDSVDLLSRLDGKSFLLAEFSMNPIHPFFYIRGVTQYPDTRFDLSRPVPVVQLKPGISEVYYVMRDAGGNADTCTFHITTIDDQLPFLQCQAVTKRYSPGDTILPLVTAEEVIVNLSDNCPIVSRDLSVTRLTCAQTEGKVPLVLTVRDGAGNINTCNTEIQVIKDRPKPDYRVNVCGGDTLFLFANPPSQQAGNTFQYRWTGPNGFTSTLQNPFLPFSNGTLSGDYSVEVTGTMGCKASGTVNVFIADLPTRAIIQGAQDFCTGISFNLRSGSNPRTGNIRYHWYQGTFPTGRLQAITRLPFYNLIFDRDTTLSYYLLIENSGCFSQPSLSREIRVVSPPVARPVQDSIQLCVGGTLSLGAEDQGTGVSYLWTGPEDFQSTLPNPLPLLNVAMRNAGNYVLTVSRTGCSQVSATVKVLVSEVPTAPSVISNSPVCAGDTLRLQSSFFPGIYTWISPDGTEIRASGPILNIPRTTTALSGDWRVRASHVSCPDAFSAFVPVLIHPFEKPVVVPTAQEVCERSAVRLAVTAPQSNGFYSWIGPSDLRHTGAALLIDSASLSQSGKYTVEFITTAGCQATASTELFVKQSVRINRLELSGDPCAGAGAPLTLRPDLQPLDNGTYAYLWTGPNGLTARTRQVDLSSLGTLANGNYRLIVTAANGCSSPMAERNVTLGSRPPRPLAPFSSEAGLSGCLNNPYTFRTSGFSGQGTTIYHWITPDGRVLETVSPILEIGRLTPADAGAYRVFIRNNNCASDTSTASILEVKPLPSLSVSHNNPVCAGSTLRLNASAFDGAIYRWTGPGNFTSTNPSVSIPDISKANEGDYTVVMTLGSCTSLPAVVSVRVLPSEVSPVLEPIADICISRQPSLTLAITPASLTAGATYIWYADGIPIDSGRQDRTILPIPAIWAGRNVLFSVQRKDAACFSDVSLLPPVTFSTIPPGRAEAGDDFSVCQATDIRLTGLAVPGATVRWRSFAPGTPTAVVIKTPDAPVTDVQGMRGGESYTFIYALSSGACTRFSEDTLVVKVKPLDEAFGGEDQVICQDAPLVLNARPPGSGPGSWSQSTGQANAGVLIQSPERAVTEVTGLKAGNQYTFTWSVSGECQVSKDEVVVLVSKKNPFAGADRVLCLKDNRVQMEAEPLNTGSSATWKSLSPGARFANPQSPTSLVFGLGAGTHAFVWEADGGVCGAQSRDTVVLKILSPPILRRDTFRMDFNTSLKQVLSLGNVQGERLNLRLLNQPTRGEASLSAAGTLEYRPKALFKGTELLVYEACLSACGCSSGEVLIEIGNDKSCLAPSIITPNGDGINDVFAIPCLFGNRFPNHQVMVYNRRGDLVFQSKGSYGNDWGGTYSGAALPGGTYFYVVTFGNGEPSQSSYLIIQY